MNLSTAPVVALGIGTAIGQLVQCSTHICAYLLPSWVNGNGRAKSMLKRHRREGKLEGIELFCTLG